MKIDNRVVQPGDQVFDVFYGAGVVQTVSTTTALVKFPGADAFFFEDGGFAGGWKRLTYKRRMFISVEPEKLETIRKVLLALDVAIEMG